MKKILSLFCAATMIFGAASGMSAFAADTAAFSPRASVVLEDGYIDGIEGIPTADFIASQFDGAISVVSPKGDTVTGEDAVPADSAVKAGDTELCRVTVYGDASCDGKINLGDAASMLKKIAKWDVAVSDRSADVTHDGKLNLGDVSLILKYLAKWDVALSYTVPVALITDGAANYSILANDADTDAAFVAAVKKYCGVDIPVVSEIADGAKFITVGADLCEKYDFINSEKADAVADDKAYIDVYNGNVYIVADGEGVDFAASELSAEFDGEDMIIPRGYAGPMTHMTERSGLYWDAYERILATEPSVDGTNGMSEDIYIAISNANYTAPKNIIYMIGDGMGKNIATATEVVYGDELYDGRLAMKCLPNISYQSTYSSDQQITDSAAGGTALSTGYKTGNGTIAMKGDHTENYKTLLELAAEQGKSTGVVATKSVTDATPASFTAHVTYRDQQVEIARQQLVKMTDGSLDLVLGGGFSYYDNESNAATVAAAIESGVTYAKDWATVESSQLPVVGLFASDAMPTDGTSGEPHIAAMTDYALERLSEDENGFFLMVEGSKIDSYGHSNDFEYETEETFEFDCAIAVALRFVALNPDTVLIITADHETGALSIPAEPTQQNITGRYGSTGHFWVDVPVYSVGYRTEELLVPQDNADVAIFAASLMSDEEFGYKSQIYDLYDLDDKATEDAILAIEKNSDNITLDGEGITVNFDSSHKYLYLPVDKMFTDAEKTKNVAAVRITMTNVSDSPKMLPSLYVKNDEASSTSADRVTHIMAGETRTVTYVLDSVMKNDGYFNAATEMALTMRSGSIDVNILDIEVVNRPFNQ